MKLNPASVLFLGVARASLHLGSRDVSRSISYKLASTIPWSPLNATSVDQSTIYNGTYYLCDRTNKGVHVIDLATSKQMTNILGFNGLTITNGKPDFEASGPNGILVLPNRNELYVGDANGIVKVIDMSTNTVVANISTGSSTRADEMAYDPNTSTVIVTNPNDDPPKVAVISASDRKVVGDVTFNNASGLEQPVWNSVNGRFYVSVPSTGANPGGEIAELDVSAMNISNVIPLSECVPAGIVFGPNQNLFVGCSQTQILQYGVAFSLVINVASGKVVANISGLAGIDQVAYDSNAKLYYAAAYQNLAGASKSGAPMPQLGIVDAESNTLAQTLTTDNATAHSVAVDTSTNQIVVPLKTSGIEVYDLTITNSTSSNSSGSTTTSGTISNGCQPISFLVGLLAIILVW